MEVNKEDAGHIFVFSSYQAMLWDNNRYDTWLYEKVAQVFTNK